MEKPKYRIIKSKAYDGRYLFFQLFKINNYNSYAGYTVVKL